MPQIKSALEEQENVLHAKKEEFIATELHAKEQLKNEALALEKAQDLANKAADKKRELENDACRLIQEEQQAQRLVSEMDTNATVTVEEKPATIDVFQHKQLETSKSFNKSYNLIHI